MEMILTALGIGAGVQVAALCVLLMTALLDKPAAPRVRSVAELRPSRHEHDHARAPEQLPDDRSVQRAA